MGGHIGPPQQIHGRCRQRPYDDTIKKPLRLQRFFNGATKGNLALPDVLLSLGNQKRILFSSLVWSSNPNSTSYKGSIPKRLLKNLCVCRDFLMGRLKGIEPL